MDRRTFLKVVGSGLAVPSALIKAKSKPPFTSKKAARKPPELLLFFSPESESDDIIIEAEWLPPYQIFESAFYPCPLYVRGFKGPICGYKGHDESCDGTFEDCRRKGNEHRWGGYPRF